MKKMLRFLKNQKGATAVEYGIMVGLIAAVIIAMVVLIGTKTNSAFNATQAAMTGTPFGGS
jgi:pilus assembly protein Flp/PilA